MIENTVYIYSAKFSGVDDSKLLRAASSRNQRNDKLICGAAVVTARETLCRETLNVLLESFS